MRDALSILDQLIAYCGEVLDKESLYKVYGLLANSEKFNLLLSLLQQDISAVLKVIEKVDYQGVDVRRLTNDLVEMLKECVVFNLTKNPLLLKKCEEEQVKSLNQKADNQRLFALIELFLEVSERFRFATNAELYFETGLLRALTIGEQKEKKQEKTAPQEIDTKEKATTFVKEEILSEDYLLSLLLRAKKQQRFALTEYWPRLADYSNDFEKALVAESLSRCEVFAVGEDFVIVCGEQNEALQLLNQSSNNSLATKLLKSISGTDYKLFVINKSSVQELLSSFNQLPQRTVPLAAAAPFSFAEEKKPKISNNPALAIFTDDELEVVD
jgi:DNA polymerase-3 subunit gamma/tau